MKTYKGKRILVKALLFAGVLSSSFVFAQSTASTSAAVTTATTTSAPGCTLMDPQVFTQNAVNQVLDVLANDQSEISSNFAAVQNDIQNVLVPIIGVQVMMHYVVSPSILSAGSAADQAAFQAAFLQYIIGLYSSPLKNFNNQTIQVYPARVAWTTQQNVQINSIIHNPAAGSSADIPVSFILQQSGCTWLFVDFVVDNISAMSNIQQQIQSILQNMTNPSLADLTAVIVKHNASS